MASPTKDLASLLRLHKWTVDERRRELGVLLSRQEELLLFGEELDRQLVREQGAAAADPATVGFIYAAFADNHRRRKEQLRRTLADLEGEIEQAREALAEAYRQLKVYEEVDKERARRARQEQGRREQAALDEIAQSQFQRGR